MSTSRHSRTVSFVRRVIDPRSGLFAGLILVIIMTSAGLGLWPTAQPSAETATATPPSVAVIAKRTNRLQIAVGQAAVDRLWPAPLRLEGGAQGPGAIEHHWPGFYAEARFHGNAVSARFDDDINRMRIVVDDGAAAIIEISRIGRQDLTISGLGDGPHSIRVEKISESSGSASFGGFFVPAADDVLAPPPGRKRLIEFIGDSDTVGYGNMSETRACSGETLYATTDTSNSFGPRVAAAMNADYRLIARSGIGLVRNYNGAEGETMPTLLRYAAPPATGADERLDDRSAVIVIGIGSNDFSPTFQPGEPWQDLKSMRTSFEPALIDLARERSKDNAGAAVVLLAFGEYGDELVGAYRVAEEALRADGIPTELTLLPKLERSACHWHPSLRDHALIADLLTQAILRILPDWAN